MRFAIKHNKCEGWFQAIAVDPKTKQERFSARFSSRSDAMGAMFKSELEENPIEEKEIKICEACGQEIPE